MCECWNYDGIRVYLVSRLFCTSRTDILRLKFVEIKQIIRVSSQIRLQIVRSDKLIDFYYNCYLYSFDVN